MAEAHKADLGETVNERKVRIEKLKKSFSYFGSGYTIPANVKRLWVQFTNRKNMDFAKPVVLVSIVVTVMVA